MMKMKQMKKMLASILCMVLIAALALIAAGCGGSAAGTAAADTQVQVQASGYERLSPTERGRRRRLKFIPKRVQWVKHCRTAD